MTDDGSQEQIGRLRALAHPLRLRILSLLTGTELSAAEVARELEITHANASYHLKVLLDSGEVVPAGEEKIRGGTAKRYRYDVTRGLAEQPADAATGPSTHTLQERLTDARATAHEIERRLHERAPGPAYFSDLEGWVPVETWRRALDLMHEASSLLHARAQPPRSPGTVHVSASSTSFTMSGGLTGDQASWRPADERDDA